MRLVVKNVKARKLGASREQLAALSDSVIQAETLSSYSNKMDGSQRNFFSQFFPFSGFIFTFVDFIN